MKRRGFFAFLFAFVAAIFGRKKDQVDSRTEELESYLENRYSLNGAVKGRTE